MASIPLALSIHNFINKVGADAGFASIIGLAILVLLYFAQARETATLREHAAEAAERIQQLEGRVSQLVRAQSTPSPSAAPAAQATSARSAAGPIVASRGVGAAARPAAAAGVASALPAAPAGVGAPALTAATKLIPTPGPAAPAPGAAVAPPEFDAGAAPPPATVAGAGVGNGHSRGSLSNLGGLPAPVSAGPGPAQPPPRVQIRPGAAPAPSRRPVGPQRASTASPPGSRTRRIIAAVVGALVVAAVVVGLIAITSSGGGGAAKTSSAANSNAPTGTRRSQPAINPAGVTVAVLNGTATARLANRVGGVLKTAGYKDGTITNAPDQTHTATVVAYLPGSKRDAVAVAKALKVTPDSVQAIDQNTRAVACPAAPAPCPVNVVVTVGADLAGTQ